MRIFNYFVFVFLVIALMSGGIFGEKDPDDDLPEEDDVEGTGPGGVGDADDLPGGTPNVPLYRGKK